MRIKSDFMRVSLILVIAILLLMSGCNREEHISHRTDSPKATTSPMPTETFDFIDPVVSIAPVEIQDESGNEVSQEQIVNAAITPIISTPVLDISVSSIPLPTLTPQPIEPSATPTAPSHQHHYTSSEVIAPGCTTEGYTIHSCSCGSVYIDTYISAYGHSWSAWAVTTEATESCSGEQARSCSVCGQTETQELLYVPVVKISTSDLESYGRNYGVSLGFVSSPSLGLNGEVCGYFPPTTGSIANMEQGRQRVANKVYGLYTSLMAMEGSDEAFRAVQCRINVSVIDNGNETYTITVYYG